MGQFRQPSAFYAREVLSDRVELPDIGSRIQEHPGNFLFFREVNTFTWSGQQSRAAAGYEANDQCLGIRLCKQADDVLCRLDAPCIRDGVPRLMDAHAVRQTVTQDMAIFGNEDPLTDQTACTIHKGLGHGKCGLAETDQEQSIVAALRIDRDNLSDPVPNQAIGIDGTQHGVKYVRSLLAGGSRCFHMVIDITSTSRFRQLVCGKAQRRPAGCCAAGGHLPKGP